MWPRGSKSTGVQPNPLVIVTSARVGYLQSNELMLRHIAM